MSAASKLDVYFYEAFEEEVEALRRHLPADIRAEFTGKTIQETGDAVPPASLISMRTQSIVPKGWGNKLSGIVSRTTGYDHLIKLNVPCGYLPAYCGQAVAEQAALFWMTLLRKLPQQLEHFARFNRDGLTGQECSGKKLLVVEKEDYAGNPGGYLVAIDSGVNAGVGERVLVIDEGNSARQIVGDPSAPVRSIIVGIVDRIDVEAYASA